ncbi:MAG: cytochrome c biogenesis protein CcsA [Proteobacteria bacterium]|jgi:cytochrome c-type biogenesis protein CcmF|nr:cytochrome c biogenesis protein CcsA [Pseudomonadota bacterium]
MALFGEIMLCVAAVLSAAGGALCLGTGGAGRRFVAGRSALYAAAAAGAVALIALVFLLLVRDYRVAYVRDYADETMSLGYLIAALWGGQQGSLALWAVLQTWFTAAAAATIDGRRQRGGALALALLAALGAFFLLLVLFESDPFSSLGTASANGIGLNPLLRNAFMVFHPPTLFLGFVGFSVPFAHAAAALVEGDGEGWIAGQRPWILFAWIFLTIGNALGMVWAYEELGWGGYWGWDPVENASLMPWLTGTALVHSALAEERLGALRRWNVVLVALTFVLIVFGTFLTRSGVIESVHAFAGATVGPYLLGLIAVIGVGVLALVVARFGALRRRGAPKRSPLRLALLHANNWLFLAATAFVAITTTMPLLSAALAGDKVTLTAEFYNTWMVPIGLAVLGLLGACAAIGWAVDERGQKALRRLGPAVGLGAAAAVMGGAALGVRPALGPIMRFAPAISVGLLVFAGAVLAAAMRRTILGARKEGRSAARGRRRLGAQVVHVAVALLFVGFLGAAFSDENQGLLRPGEGIAVAGYRLDFMGLRDDRDVSREAVIADLDARGPGGAIGVMSPARHTYHSHPGQPTSEVAVERGLGEDLFVILGETDEESGAAVIRVVVNPLVAWVWIGSALLVLGGVIALVRPGALTELVELRPDLRARLAAPFLLIALGTFAVAGAGAIWDAATAVAVLGGLSLAAALFHVAATLRSFLEPGAVP